METLFGDVTGEDVQWACDFFSTGTSTSFGPRYRDVWKKVLLLGTVGSEASARGTKKVLGRIFTEHGGPRASSDLATLLKSAGVRHWPASKGRNYLELCALVSSLEKAPARHEDSAAFDLSHAAWLTQLSGGTGRVELDPDDDEGLLSFHMTAGRFFRSTYERGGGDERKKTLTYRLRDLDARERGDLYLSVGGAVVDHVRALSRSAAAWSSWKDGDDRHRRQFSREVLEHFYGATDRRAGCPECPSRVKNGCTFSEWRNMGFRVNQDYAKGESRAKLHLCSARLESAYLWMKKAEGPKFFLEAVKRMREADIPEALPTSKRRRRKVLIFPFEPEETLEPRTPEEMFPDPPTWEMLTRTPLAGWDPTKTVNAETIEQFEVWTDHYNQMATTANAEIVDTWNLLKALGGTPEDAGEVAEKIAVIQKMAAFQERQPALLLNGGWTSFSFAAYEKMGEIRDVVTRLVIRQHGDPRLGVARHDPPVWDRMADVVADMFVSRQEELYARYTEKFGPIDLGAGTSAPLFGYGTNANGGGGGGGTAEEEERIEEAFFKVREGLGDKSAAAAGDPAAANNRRAWIWRVWDRAREAVRGKERKVAMWTMLALATIAALVFAGHATHVYDGRSATQEGQTSSPGTPTAKSVNTAEIDSKKAMIVLNEALDVERVKIVAAWEVARDKALKEKIKRPDDPTIVIPLERPSVSLDSLLEGVVKEGNAIAQSLRNALRLAEAKTGEIWNARSDVEKRLSELEVGEDMYKAAEEVLLDLNREFEKTQSNEKLQQLVAFAKGSTRAGTALNSEMEQGAADFMGFSYASESAVLAKRNGGPLLPAESSEHIERIISEVAQNHESAEESSVGIVPAAKQETGLALRTARPLFPGGTAAAEWVESGKAAEGIMQRVWGGTANFRDGVIARYKGPTATAAQRLAAASLENFEAEVRVILRDYDDQIKTFFTLAESTRRVAATKLAEAVLERVKTTTMWQDLLPEWLTGIWGTESEFFDTLLRNDALLYEHSKTHVETFLEWMGEKTSPRLFPTLISALTGTESLVSLEKAMSTIAASATRLGPVPLEDIPEQGRSGRAVWWEYLMGLGWRDNFQIGIMGSIGSFAFMNAGTNALMRRIASDLVVSVTEPPMHWSANLLTGDRWKGSYHRMWNLLRPFESIGLGAVWATTAVTHWVARGARAFFTAEHWALRWLELGFGWLWQGAVAANFLKLIYSHPLTAIPATVLLLSLPRIMAKLAGNVVLENYWKTAKSTAIFVFMLSTPIGFLYRYVFHRRLKRWRMNLEMYERWTDRDTERKTDLEDKIREIRNDLARSTFEKKEKKEKEKELEQNKEDLKFMDDKHDRSGLKLPPGSGELIVYFAFQAAVSYVAPALFTYTEWVLWPVDLGGRIMAWVGDLAASPMLAEYFWFVPDQTAEVAKWIRAAGGTVQQKLNYGRLLYATVRTRTDQAIIRTLERGEAVSIEGVIPELSLGVSPELEDRLWFFANISTSTFS